MNECFDNEEFIINRYLSGILPHQIAESLNCTERDIRMVLKQRQVDRRYNTFKDELYDRIVDLYQNGATQEFICNALLIGEHCISKTLNKRGIKKRSTSDANRRYYRNRYYFDSIDTQNKAYILGLLFADGSNIESHNSIVLSLQEQDGYLVEAVKRELEYTGPIYFIKLHDKNIRYKNQCRLCVNDERLSHALATLGIVNNKSLIAQFPGYIPDDLMHHFIRGYFDGDGSVSYSTTSRKAYVSIVGTLDFCNHIKDVLYEHDIKSSIQHPKQSGDHNTFVVSINGFPNVLGLMYYLYQDADLKMFRKYEKFLQIRSIINNAA